MATLESFAYHRRSHQSGATRSILLIGDAQGHSLSSGLVRYICLVWAVHDENLLPQIVNLISKKLAEVRDHLLTGLH